MKALKPVLLIIAALPSFMSCKAVLALVHKDAVVAKVGSHKLYRSELAEYVPNGVSPEDSTKLALQYINAWATDQVFSDVAQEQLSKKQKDVSKEIEDYKNSLLKYRYEQQYINERLDTAVSSQQISDYYGKNKDKFNLEVPIVKARFLSILSDSPNLEIIKKKMSSSDIDDQMAADSLSYSSALKYSNYDDKWIDVISLAREFGTDYVTMLSKKEGSFIEIPDGRGNIDIAFIVQMKGAGETAPLEYCSGRIKDIIISSRKHALISTLEQDLLEEARDKERFVIY
jgi:hypothetical protein